MAPSTLEEALRDAVRWCENGIEMSRDDIKRAFKAVNPVTIVSAMQKKGNGLTGGVDAVIANTVDYAMRLGMIKRLVDAIGAIAAIQLEVAEGGVFVGGERRPADQAGNSTPAES